MTKSKQLNIKDYEEMLKQHDWYYMMSEDSNVYKRGSFKQQELRELSGINDEFKELFKQYQNKHKIN